MVPTSRVIIPGLLTLSVLFGLSGCSTPPPKEPVKPQADLVLKEPKISAAEQRIAKLEAAIEEAKRSQNWDTFISQGHALWQEADKDNRLAIEYMIWKTLDKAFASPNQLNVLSLSLSAETRQWADLLNALRQPGLFQQQALQDLTEFQPDALYQQHLLPALALKQQHSQHVRQIAVLLPNKGKYEHLSQKIRNGLIKAYMSSDQSVQLKFYDTTNPERALEQYQLAKQEGADWVIGPLQKASIEKLQGQKLSHTLVLNQADDSHLWSFNFRAQNESEQITQQLQSRAVQRIGILSSESKRDMKTAQKLASNWLENEDHRADLNPYPLKNPNLRKALGGLINEEQSQKRYNNIRWLLGQKLEFFPRTRQDLQAIVLIGNERQVSVFHPQFEFFQLDLPVYATSNLTPRDLQNIKTSSDLANITFPTIPAAFNATGLNNELEAFGWDSFQLVNQFHKLAPNLCLRTTQSGVLYIENQQVAKKLVWANYNDKGQLTLLQPQDAPLSEQEQLEALMEQERLQALQSELNTLASDSETTSSLGTENGNTDVGLSPQPNPASPIEQLKPSAATTE